LQIAARIARHIARNPRSRRPMTAAVAVRRLVMSRSYLKADLIRGIECAAAGWRDDAARIELESTDLRRVDHAHRAAPSIRAGIKYFRSRLCSDQCVSKITRARSTASVSSGVEIHSAALARGVRIKTQRVILETEAAEMTVSERSLIGPSQRRFP